MCGGHIRINLYDCGCKKAFAFAADVCYTVCEIEFYECQSARLSHTEVSPGGETSGAEFRGASDANEKLMPCTDLSPTGLRFFVGIFVDKFRARSKAVG